MLDEKGVVQKENDATIIQKEGLYEENIFSEPNRCIVRGIIEAGLEYSHETFGEKFYKTRVRVKRKSDTEDLVPIVVSGLLIGQNKKKYLEGKWIEATGQFRSYNKLGADGRPHLKVFLFVREINIYDDEEGLTYKNEIYLDGYIGKRPIFRKTYSKTRLITDLFIAVNRAYGKSDYIPCIAWGRLAQWSSTLKVGDRVQVYGKVQSRIWLKQYSEDSQVEETITAYEISAIRIEKVED